MGYPITVALRYLASKKRNMISISTALAIGGVALGVTALAIVMSVTGGFKEQFREKVLGVNAHVLVLKYSIDFREYRDVMKKVEAIPHVTGVAPFVINPMMVTHGDHTATGVLLKGVDPTLMPAVLHLPKDVVAGSLAGLRRPGAKPPERSFEPLLQRELDQAHSSPKPDPTNDALLTLIQKEVEQEMRRADGGAEAAAVAPELDDVPPVPPPPPNPVAPVAATAATTAQTPPTPAAAPKPVDLTPVGGYKSHPPDDDYIPDAIDPDPCKSADQVARMPGIVVGRTLSRQLDVGLG